MSEINIVLTVEQLRQLERNGELGLPGRFNLGVTGITLKMNVSQFQILGSEIKKFWDEGWDKDFYHDDYEEPLQDEDSGDWILEDDKRYDIRKFGYCIFQGSASNPKDNMSFADAFLAWKGKK